jgi:mannose-1-phosphate guanylyltransferase/phosphomannomutase
VESGARIGPYTVLGSNVRVRRDVDLERAVVHDNAYLGETVRLRGSVVGRACDLRRGARCDEGAVLGDECFVGENAHIGTGVKVYPFKTVEAGATINSSIIWESKGARSLFGRHGVTGLANVDVTPELAARVGMAWATTLKKNATVIASRDSSRSGRMLKRALMTGLNASGVNVLDLEVAPVPVTRFLVHQPLPSGGVTIRLVQGDTQAVIVRFFDEAGLDLSEDVQRKVERLFNREDYRRVLPGEIGDIGFPPRALEQYTEALCDTVDVSRVADAGLKLVVDYGYGSTSFVMPNVLAKLGADVLGVNPYAATVGTIGFDRFEHAANVASVVRASGAHVGAVLDPDGEHLTLVDDEGHILTDTESLLAMCTLVSGHLLGDHVAVPVSTTRSVQDLVKPRGVTVLWTKTSTAALMAASSEERVGFAAGPEGGFILPGFLPAFDAAAALVKLLELLAKEQVRLSEVVASLPRVHMVHETVVTPWERKGLVMRSLMEQSSGRPIDLIDGVKVWHGDAWVLTLPDTEEPVTHLWAEADSDAEARRLAQEYARRIRQLVR